jgi:hypothetical protein
MNRQTIGRIQKLEDQQVPTEHQITLIQLVDPITGQVGAEIPVDRTTPKKAQRKQTKR